MNRLLFVHPVVDILFKVYEVSDFLNLELIVLSINTFFDFVLESYPIVFRGNF